MKIIRSDVNAEKPVFAQSIDLSDVTSIVKPNERKLSLYDQKTFRFGWCDVSMWRTVTTATDGVEESVGVIFGAYVEVVVHPLPRTLLGAHQYGV
jgi:hypothetical protein